jgi:predicted phosphodiesterase
MKKQDLDNLSSREKKLVRQSLQALPVSRTFDHSMFYGQHIRFGYYSDPHCGEKQFKEPLWRAMVHFFKKEGITVVYCPGDNLEGMSGRPGHIYNLAHIGATAQLDYATELFHMAPTIQFHIIDGNHDQWLKEKNNAGLVAGAELARRNPNVKFLGEWEARIKLARNVEMMLFHGNDGTAYADSYKLQKLIESLEGGKKPQIILSGHYHKQVAIFRRNVFGFECGTLCGQTGFMRGKKLPAHVGFGVIDIWTGKRGIERLRHEFFPYFD